MASVRIPIHFDMETQDPDDVLTLSILATHPAAELSSVSLTPGGPDQVGLVRHVLSLLGRTDIPVGGDPSRTKPCVSSFHDAWLGGRSAPVDLVAADVLRDAAARGCTLLTGGPLKNFAGRDIPPFPRWVAQGGFAGDSVVPPEHRLPKFAGRETCATFNFNGAPAAALAMLASPLIGEKLLVSKNVCHGVAWDPTFHARVAALPGRTPGLQLAFEGMGLYLRKRPEGKLLHDPLAMAVTLDPSVCSFERVEVYRKKGEWGSRKDPEGGAMISVSVDRERLFKVLTAS